MTEEIKTDNTETLKNALERIDELEKEYKDLEWQFKEVIEDNDYWQAENKKLIQENAELKFNLDYAKAVMRELLDNSNEYSKARAEDFIKE